MTWVRILVLFCLTLVCRGVASLELSIASGRIRGKTVEGIDGEKVDVFLGIPYGAPTGGQSRFSPPKEASPWNDVLDTTEFSKPCLQVATSEMRQNWWVSSNEESENCLTINVWVPKPRPKASAVMVWIHGGGFAQGSSDVSLYDGARLAAQEDVIVVSLNYRLSVYGFLYLDHPLAPGNVGLMDQTLGLQWVKNNIESFGGDPRRVTIFGESAGGASVGFHVLSPPSLDLFQNAILQSGNINGDWPTQKPKDALEQSLLLAKRVGCPVLEGDREETLRCLQDLSHEKLSEAALTFPVFAFKAVVDGKYLPACPRQLLSEGKFCNQKKIMIGVTKDDGSLLMPMRGVRSEKLSHNEEELRQLMSHVVYVDRDISGLPLDVVCHTYSEWNPETASFGLTFEAVIRAATDRFFACPALTKAESAAQKGNSVFFYVFNHISEHNKPSPPWMGVFHGSEIPFVFGGIIQGNNDQEDVKLAKQIMRYWANFAKTGDPNNEYLPTWSKFTSQNKRYLNIAAEGMVMEKMEFIKDCNFWENILPKLGR